jgi:hypothetical protein
VSRRFAGHARRAWILLAVAPWILIVPQGFKVCKDGAH